MKLWNWLPDILTNNSIKENRRSFEAMNESELVAEYEELLRGKATRGKLNRLRDFNYFITGRWYSEFLANRQQKTLEAFERLSSDQDICEPCVSEIAGLNQ